MSSYESSVSPPPSPLSEVMSLPCSEAEDDDDDDMSSLQLTDTESLTGISTESGQGSEAEDAERGEEEGFETITHSMTRSMLNPSERERSTATGAAVSDGEEDVDFIVTIKGDKDEKHATPSASTSMGTAILSKRPPRASQPYVAELSFPDPLTDGRTPFATDGADIFDSPTPPEHALARSSAMSSLVKSTMTTDLEESNATVTLERVRRATVEDKSVSTSEGSSHRVKEDDDDDGETSASDRRPTTWPKLISLGLIGVVLGLAGVTYNINSGKLVELASFKVVQRPAASATMHDMRPSESAVVHTDVPHLHGSASTVSIPSISLTNKHTARTHQALATSSQPCKQQGQHAGHSQKESMHPAPVPPFFVMPPAISALTTATTVGLSALSTHVTPAMPRQSQSGAKDATNTSHGSRVPRGKQKTGKTHRADTLEESNDEAAALSVLASSTAALSVSQLMQPGVAALDNGEGGATEAQRANDALHQPSQQDSEGEITGRRPQTRESRVNRKASNLVQHLATYNLLPIAPGKMTPPALSWTSTYRWMERARRSATQSKSVKRVKLHLDFAKGRADAQDHGPEPVSPSRPSFCATVCERACNEATKRAAPRDQTQTATAFNDGRSEAITSLDMKMFNLEAFVRELIQASLFDSTDVQSFIQWLQGVARQYFSTISPYLTVDDNRKENLHRIAVDAQTMSEEALRAFRREFYHFQQRSNVALQNNLQKGKMKLMNLKERSKGYDPDVLLRQSILTSTFGSKDMQSCVRWLQEATRQYLSSISTFLTIDGGRKKELDRMAVNAQVTTEEALRVLQRELHHLQQKSNVVLQDLGQQSQEKLAILHHKGRRLRGASKKTLARLARKLRNAIDSVRA